MTAQVNLVDSGTFRMTSKVPFRDTLRSAIKLAGFAPSLWQALRIPRSSTSSIAAQSI